MTLSCYIWCQFPWSKCAFDRIIVIKLYQGVHCRFLREKQLGLNYRRKHKHNSVVQSITALN